jgi:hypothetical protein
MSSRSILHASVVVRRNPEVTGRDMREGEGVLLLHTRTGAYHRLNRTGALIWRFLDEPVRFDTLQRRLLDEIPDAPAEFAEDLNAHVADMAGRDLVLLQPQALP